MIWVAVSALSFAVLVLGWLVRECRLENERLREDLEREASSLQAKVLGILGAPKVDVTRSQRIVTRNAEEYKDTTHAQGLWQAGIEERLSDLNLHVCAEGQAVVDGRVVEWIGHTDPRLWPEPEEAPDAR